MGNIFGGDEPIERTASEAREATDRAEAVAEPFDMGDVGKQIDITVDGEYGDEGEFKLVGTLAQLDKLRELLARHVDLDVIEYDNGDPDGAQFVREFIAEAESAIEQAREVQEANN